MEYKHRSLLSCIIDGCMVLSMLLSAWLTYHERSFSGMWVAHVQLLALTGFKCLYHSYGNEPIFKRRFYLFSLALMFAQTLYFTTFVQSYMGLPQEWISHRLLLITLVCTPMTIGVSWLTVLIPEIEQMYKHEEQQL